MDKVPDMDTATTPADAPLVRSSGRLSPPPMPDRDRIGPAGYSHSPMPADVARVPMGDRRTHTEGVAWCNACGAVAPTADRIAHATPDRRGRGGCTGADVTGARIPAAIDGPRATDDPRRVAAIAHRGTGHDVRPDVTPALLARGDRPTRTTAARADRGAVKVGRLSVIGAWSLRVGTPDVPAWADPRPVGTFRADVRPDGSPMPAGVAVAWGIGRRVTATGAPDRTARRGGATTPRRSRAAIIAATAPAPAEELCLDVPADVTADAAAMLAAGTIG